MPSRAVLVSAALCIVLLATGFGITGVAANHEEPINVTTTDETAVIEVGSCEGIGCRFSSEPYELYINGEHEQSLDYGDEYRISDSAFTDNTSRVVVTNKNFITDDEGWAYLVERKYPREQSADGRDNARNKNASNQGNGSGGESAPPEVVVEPGAVDEFSECFEEGKWHLLLEEESKLEYCSDEAFN